MTRLQYPCSTPTSIVREFIGDLKLWRRGWDSNPRYGFPYARFRGEYFQPLSHLSVAIRHRNRRFGLQAMHSSWRNVIFADPRYVVGTYRRSAKNDWMTATHSSPRTPAVTST